MWKLVDAFSVQAGCYLVQAGSQKLIVEGEYKSTSALSSTQHNLNGGPNNVKPGQQGSRCGLQTQETFCVGPAKCISLKLIGFKRGLCFRHVTGKTMGMSLGAGIQFCRDVINNSHTWNCDQAEKWCPLKNKIKTKIFLANLQTAELLTSCGQPANYFQPCGQ